MNQQANNKDQQKQQRKENREFVTPYAFGVADDLLGVRLASPVRRGVAMLLDLLFITLLTQLPGWILGGLFSITFFRAGGRVKQRKKYNWARLSLRAVAALLMFVVIMGLVDDNQYLDSSTQFNPLVELEGVQMAETFVLTAIQQGLLEVVRKADCQQNADCWQQQATELGQQLSNTDLSVQQISEIASDLAAEMPATFTADQQQAFSMQVISSFERYKDDPPPTTPEQQSLSEQQEAQIPDTAPQASCPDSEVGVLAWLKAISDDLGLGFGWATLYFSVFTAWWGGQTPAKKLCRIKVIKLDASPLNLWDSFGRYGGYGAGLATGLLGFLQLLWDANRQAIQDKISETLVVSATDLSNKDELGDFHQGQSLVSQAHSQPPDSHTVNPSD